MEMKPMKGVLVASYALFALTLAVATLVEWRQGSEFVGAYVYKSTWFAALLAELALTGAFVAGKILRKNVPALVLHFAFLLILGGALATKTLGTHGTLHLRQNQETSVFVSDEKQVMKLPFAVSLGSFQIVNYPHTDAPMDFRSVVRIDGGEFEVSMNKVLRYGGYRFLQSSYDADLQGSVLAVNHDPWGIALSYAGYALLALGFVLVLLNPKGRYRALLRKVAAAVAAATLVSCGAGEAELSSAPSRELCRCFDEVFLMRDNRIVPFRAYATDFTLKLTGKTSYKGLTAEQVMLGWLLYPKEWQHEPMLAVKDAFPESAGIGQKGRIAVSDLFAANGDYKLAALLNRPNAPKAVTDANDKLQLIIMLTAGEALRLFPDSVQWHPIRAEDEFSVRFFSTLKKAADANDEDLLRTATGRLVELQRCNAGAVLPSPLMAEVEVAYNRIRPTSWMSYSSLFLGLLFLAFGIARMSGRRIPGVASAMKICMLCLIVCQAVALAVRGGISGSVPLSNGYETMLFLALCISLFALVARNIMPLVLPMGFLLSGFALLVAHIGLKNPEITPLMPVLHSPWLSSHVATIMMSYALFFVIAVNSLVALLFPKNQAAQADASMILLYPAVALLAVGIFIGAVWANESWGTYWSWDPKEVWALITMLVYAVPLHPALVPRIAKPCALHVYLLLSLLCVLMTYFGVNYLLGGMHAYN